MKDILGDRVIQALLWAVVFVGLLAAIGLLAVVAIITAIAWVPALVVSWIVYGLFGDWRKNKLYSSDAGLFSTIEEKDHE